MTRFEDNLWHEVQRTYGSALSEADGPLQRGARLRAPVIAGTSLGVMGAGVTAAVILSAASSSPAFAVTRHPDGTVSVVIRRVEGIAGANRRLAQLGIRARAVRVDDGCPVSASAAGTLARVTVATLARAPHQLLVAAAGKARIEPTQIPSGTTLVIPALPAGSAVRLVRGRVVQGAIPACLPPVVQVQTSSSTGVRTIACRAGILLHPRAIAPSPQATTTDTNGTPSPATVTQTMTNSGTATNSNSTPQSTNTNDTGTTTSEGTGSPSSSPGGPSLHWSQAPHVQLPPPLLRACLLAIQRAAR